MPMAGGGMSAMNGALFPSSVGSSAFSRCPVGAPTAPLAHNQSQGSSPRATPKHSHSDVWATSGGKPTLSATGRLEGDYACAIGRHTRPRARLGYSGVGRARSGSSPLRRRAPRSPIHERSPRA